VGAGPNAAAPGVGSLGFSAPGGQPKVPSEQISPGSGGTTEAGGGDPTQPAAPAKEKTWLEKNWYLVLPGAVLVRYYSPSGCRIFTYHVSAGCAR